MNKEDLTVAIKVAKEQLMKLTHETLRPNQGFKMRTHGPIIGSIITAIRYYEEELNKLNAPKRAAPKKED